MTDQDLQAEEPAEAATPEVENAETATAPESGDAEKPEAEASEETPEEKPKPKGGFQRRIDELTRNWREAERRNDELLSILKGNRAEPETTVPEKPPTLEEFGYDEAKYQQALTGFVREQAKAEARSIFQQERQKLQQETRTQTFKQREAEFAETVEDYADKVYDPSLPLSATVVEMIAESDIGPKVAYYLAGNPDIARSMYSMSPTQAAREFGKLEAKLSVPVAKKAVSTAPPPPPKISAIETAFEKDPDKMSMEEWLKWREKQTRKRR
jgi:hypothetical protein